MENEATQTNTLTEEQIQLNSDEWFVNNLVGLAKAELVLVQSGKKERVNRHMLARFAFDQAQKR